MCCFWQNGELLTKLNVNNLFFPQTNWNNILFVTVVLACTSTGRVGLWFLLFYVQEHPKAQSAVVLVLKRPRRRGNGLKSHPKDWEKPKIEPATPGLQNWNNI